MEERVREATPVANVAPAPPPETLAEGSRRRANAPKRKGPTSISSSSSSTSSKRLAKERSHLPFVPYAHNGPVTRARQSPNKFAANAAAAAAAAGAAAAAAVPQNSVEQPAALDAARTAGLKESEAAGEQLAREDEVLEPVEEPLVDAQFEAVRTRGSGVHVVPTHAGWFSWEKIHPLEERTMTSFFNGKSENRTSDIYKKIRNSIMEKFHSDPQVEIELNHLSEMDIGDMDARQEVMEFLDHWGLINFHPFPPSTSNTSASNTEETPKMPSLSEKLYQFETVHPAPRLAPKSVDLSAPAMPPRLFPESAIADDLVRPEGPSVEYHCNSCSADCSRKRYHCQKQADFDLCTECYNDGKFGSGMTPADFILMEPAEVPGIGGGSWTDQETLLLLEALELYGENWNEIAEHVATKTKAQCMLHFVQMPIEDSFLEGDEDKYENLSRKSDVLISKDPSSDVPQEIENKIIKKENGHDASADGMLKEMDGCKVEPVQGTSSSSIAINALKTAFQTVGSLPEEGGVFSFAEAGNPVMALAAFLVALVDHDLALTSLRSSLKAMSEDSSGIQLATRHCFTLEDPPKHGKDQHASESEGAQKEEVQVLVISGNDGPLAIIDKTDKIEGQTNNIPSVSEECTQDHNTNKSTNLDVSVKEGVPSKESGDISFPEAKNVQRSIKDSRELSLPNEKAAGSNDNSSGNWDPHRKGDQNTTKESGEPHAEVTPYTSKETRGKAFPMPKEGNFALPGEQVADAANDSGDVMTAVEGNKEYSEMSKAVNMLLTEEKEHVTADSSAVGISELAGEGDSKLALSDDERNWRSKDDVTINRIRQAAVTALSAAAVNAKLLANQEEDQIRQLVSMIVGKQLQKLEIKLAFFSEMENVILRVREQLDRARQRLVHERAQIIAARLGLPASSSRSIPPSLPANKFAMSHGFSGSRPLNQPSQKSPLKK